MDGPLHEFINPGMIWIQGKHTYKAQTYIHIERSQHRNKGCGKSDNVSQEWQNMWIGGHIYWAEK